MFSVLVVSRPEENIKICFSDLLLSLCNSSFSIGMLKFSQANRKWARVVYVCVNSSTTDVINMKPLPLIFMHYPANR